MACGDLNMTCPVDKDPHTRLVIHGQSESLTKQEDRQLLHGLHCSQSSFSRYHFMTWRQHLSMRHTSNRHSCHLVSSILHQTITMTTRRLHVPCENRTRQELSHSRVLLLSETNGTPFITRNRKKDNTEFTSVTKQDDNPRNA